MGAVAVFYHINALPGAQCHASPDDRDRQAGGQQHCLDVPRHVVRSLVGMGEEGLAGICRGGHKAMQPGAQVGLNLWVRVFLYQQTGRGVADEQRQQSVTRRQPGGDGPGDLGQAGAGGVDGECGVQGVSSVRVPR